MTTSGAGRPREFDRDAVLDRAVDIFWRHGYRGATTRILERELGLTQSSIYNAFGSKAGLMRAALDRYEQRLERELVAPAFAAGGDPRALDRFVRSVVAWVHGDGRAGCMLLNAAAEGAPDEQVAARAQRYRDRLRTLFAAAFAAGGCTTNVAADRADALLAGVLGINIVARSGPGTVELDRLADALRREVVAARPNP